MAEKERPARKQADHIDEPYQSQVGGLYNIWYNKICGDYTTWRERREMKLAGPRYRCDPKRDSGKTRAKPDAYICLFFARGKCVLGDQCTYLHRIPTEEDEKKVGLAYDIFGRERHKTDREDMGGRGSFERNNRTLYIGGLKIRPGMDIKEIIYRHFSQFGEIDHLNVIPNKSIAFVRYKLRGCAEFAKEAMADQSLDGDEVLNVRWANPDPNPLAQERDELETLQLAAKAISEKYPQYWEQATAMMMGAYPNTDTQYIDYSQYSQYMQDPNYYAYYAQYYAQQAAAQQGQITQGEQSQQAQTTQEVQQQGQSSSGDSNAESTKKQLSTAELAEQAAMNYYTYPTYYYPYPYSYPQQQQ